LPIARVNFTFSSGKRFDEVVRGVFEPLIQRFHFRISNISSTGFADLLPISLVAEQICLANPV
jgi:hypothetical protein